MSLSVVVGSVGSVGVERVVAALQSELCEEALAYIVRKGKGKGVMEQRRFCWHWEGKGRERKGTEGEGTEGKGTEGVSSCS